MTPESRNRFAVLVERRLAGLLTESETAELSQVLESSPEARELYLRAVEFHLDLGAAMDKQEIRTARAPRISLQAVVSIAAGLLFAMAGFWYFNLQDSVLPDGPSNIAHPRSKPGSTKVVETELPPPKALRTPPDVPPPPPPPPQPAGPAQIAALFDTDGLILEINGRFDALPSGYRGLLMGKDRGRFDDLVRSGRGTSDDIEWLKTRILGETIPSFQRDAEMIRAKLLELEPKLKENVASDVIYRKNGTNFEGQIVEETESSVKIKLRFGAVTIPKEDIQRIEKGKGAAMEFPAKYAEASTAPPAEKLEKLSALLAWCIEKSLKTQKEYVAFVILSLDASHENARRASGMAKPLPGPSLLPASQKK